jgi:hypothetical protein
MKSLIKVAAIVATLAVPALSHAQSSQVTRAQVREQLAQLEKAGYNPNLDVDYPQDLQRAEAVVASQNTGISGYGSDAAGTAQSGK